MQNFVFDIRFYLNCMLLIEWVCFLLASLTRKYSFRTTVLALSGGIALSLFLAVLMPYRFHALREAFGLVALAVCSFVVFADKWPKKLFAVAMMYIDTVFCECFLVLLFPESLKWIDTATGIVQFRFIAMYGLVLATLLLLTSRIFTYMTSRFSAKEWLLFALFPVSQVLVLPIWGLSEQPASETSVVIWQVVSVFICIGADVALYFAIRGMAQRAELSVQNKLLAEQIDMQEQHYAALADQYERMRIMRHDIANHVHTIQILLNKGDAQAARDYAAETLAEQVFHSSLGECEQPIVDAFLYGRIQSAEAEGIRVEVEVRLPREIGIANTDLIAAFGNLLDNATEACKKLPADARYIHLTAAVRDAFLAIRMENSVDSQETGHRTKRIGGLERGLGFHILSNLAERYHGNFQSEREGGRFLTTLLLKMDEALQ